MSHHLSAIFLLLVVAFPSVTAKPVPKAAPKEELLYFPTSVGTEWVYEDDGSTCKFVVTKVEPMDQATIVTVGIYQSNGKTTQHFNTVEVSKSGIRETVNFHRRIEPPTPLLKLPCAKGDKWESPFSIDGERRADYVMTAGGIEEVKVPAGTFKAIRVEQVSTDLHGRINQTITTWYAPGVGPVRIVYRSGSTRDLVSFKRGNDEVKK